MCEFCKSLHEFPWCFLRWMLHVLRHAWWMTLALTKSSQLYIIRKMINIAIRATYYIFCCRNRNWDSPDLMQFWFLLLLLLLLLLFFFLLNNPISSSICKLPIRSEIYNCTFKNTNKVYNGIIAIIIIIVSLKKKRIKQRKRSQPFVIES